MNLVKNDELAKLNVLLLLDENSRKRIKVNLADVSNYNVRIIYSLGEITSEIGNNYKTLIVLEDFVKHPDGISELKLFKEVFHLSILYLSKDRTWLTFMSRYAKCYMMDISTLNYEKLYAVVMNDTGLLENVCLLDEDLVEEGTELANLILEDKEADFSAKCLAADYKALADMSVLSHNLLLANEKKLEDTQRAYISESSTVYKFSRGYIDLVSRTRELNENLIQYESIITKDVYNKVLLSQYRNRPIVIYLKEYEELIHFNSFIETLYGAITEQLKLSCKVLRLYDGSVSKKLKAIPAYYKIIRNKYTNSDILISDFLVKYGAYDKILELILANQMGLNILIIVDNKDHNDIVTVGQDITLNLCRNYKDINLFGLPEQNTICNNCMSAEFLGMTWDTYEDFKDYEGDDKLLYLTSKPVIQDILDLIEERQRMI